MRRYTIEIGGTGYVVDVHETSVDTFEVQVADASYVVTLAAEEELHEGPGAADDGGGGAVGAAVPSLRIARKAPATPAAAAMLIKAAAGKAGSNALSAPMPGVIIEIGVVAGDTIARGQLVAVLDAMKMHNNIRSPRAGVVAEVCVTPGQAVGHGDAIVRFRDD